MTQQSPGDHTAHESYALHTRKVFLARTAAGVVAFPSLAAFISACGSNGSSDRSSTTGTPATSARPKVPTGTVRVAIANAPQTVDPSLVTDVAAMTITETVYEPLVSFNDDYTKLDPVLAESWRSNDDATEWEFTLREGVKFHDGADFDATAVRKSLEYLSRKTGFYGFLIGDAKIDDADPGVVKFRYSKPFPDLLDNLTFACGIISPKLLTGSVPAAEKRVGREPAGTGPYRFARRSGQGVTLQPWDGYWGSGPYVERMEFVTIPDESSRTSALQAGDVDLVLQVPPRAAKTLRSNSNLAVVGMPSWTTTALMAVCNRKPFDDVRVRRAMAHALDRKTIVDKVLLGEAALEDSMFPPGIRGHHVPPTKYEYDPAKARALLKEAGYPNGVSVALSTRSDQVLVNEISQALAGQLRDGGFNVTVDVLDIAVFEGDKAKENPKYELHWNEWGWVTGGAFHFTLGGIAAQSKWTNPEYEALRGKFMTTANGPERDKISNAAIDLWAEEAPWLTLWVPTRLDAAQGGVQDYRAAPRTATPLTDLYLDTAA